MLGGIFGRKAGGSALKGEDKVSCAMRELLEETGISSNDLQEISCYTSHDTIYYCFLCVTDCDKASITLLDDGIVKQNGGLGNQTAALQPMISCIFERK